MSDRRPGESTEGGEGGFDWDSPRWRENDSDRASAERGRRARSTPSPHQRGAIDEGDSVAGKHPAREPAAHDPDADEDAPPAG